MDHIIAFNPYKNGNKGSVNSQSLSAYDKTIGYPWLRNMIAAIRRGNSELKRQLPFRCTHYSRFNNNHRTQDDAVPESFLFQTTVDVDDKEYVDKAIERARQLNCSDTPWRGALLHLEYSARKKLHIDIRMPLGMTIEETQRAYCQALGVPYDESCTTPERMIFITDKDSEIYRSKDWYAVLPEAELAKRRQAFLDRGLSIDGRKQPGTRPQPFNTQHSTFNTQKNAKDNRLPGTGSDNAVSAGPAVQPAPAGGSNASHISDSGPAGARQEAGPVEASEKNLVAFELFRDAAGLKAVDINAEGSRHSSLLAIMSAGASRVMGEDELRAVVALKMPAFAAEHDCRQLIHDFYAKYGDSSKPMSQAVIHINATAERMALGAKDSSPLTPPSSLPPAGWPDPPAMPGKLPKLVELLISKTPDVYKPAVANAVFPSLAAHLWHTTFRYIDNVAHEATLMCCLLAGTGAGKNCVQQPIDCIMADIRRRDRENLKREKEWKEEMTRKGANKDKRKRPDNLVIQEIDADMTNPAFVMRTAEAQEHFLYCSLNEVNQFDALRGQGGQQFVIMCLAFDPGNRYGQTRVGTQSVTERVTIRFNWNASTTIHKGQKYFGRVLTDGPISRINFCTIPEREIGADMPVYGTYDEAFGQALQPYIDNLCQAGGLIDCPEAFQLALKLKDENAEFARVSQSRIYENLSFRANVIAYLKACVLYVANGYKWEPEIDDFIRWSEQYDLYCKMRFFGEAIERAENEGVRSARRGPRNLLQDLPDEFTMQDVVATRLRNGLDQSGTHSTLKTWMHRGYIRRKENAAAAGGNSFSSFSFIKLKYRSDGVELEDK